MDDSMDNNDLVPDSLLAFAKDHRYLESCQALIQQIFVAPKEEAWWWSLLLYATLVVRKNGTTLGMEFMGLQHANSSSSIVQRRLFHLVLAAGWTVWARRCLPRLKYNQEEQEEERHEQLRGAARQYFYQEQRRAMMQRARGDVGHEASLTRTIQPANAATASARDASNDWMKRIRKLFKRGIQIMSEALSCTLDNPHSLPDTASLISIGRWIMRLHLAHYCMTGKFPTIWHRILTHNVERRRQDSSRIADPPPTTHKLVGRLILIQAGATLSQAVSRWLVSYLASRRRIQQEQEHNNHTDNSNDNDAVVTLSLRHCGICRMPRSHSAAPKSCGHVFCWKCLYQWVSTVRPSCPLCRVACRPQDILALHNY